MADNTKNSIVFVAIFAAAINLQACSTVENAGDAGGAVAGIAVGVGSQLAGTGVRAVGDVAGGIISWIPVVGGPLSTAVNWTTDLAATSVEIVGTGAGAAISAVGSQAIYLTQAGAYYKLAEEALSVGNLAAVTLDTVGSAAFSEISRVASPENCFMNLATREITCNNS